MQWSSERDGGRKASVMAIFEKKQKKEEQHSSAQDYRAPSDTGSSDEPDVVAGAASESPGASPVLSGAAAVEGDARTPEGRLDKLRAWRGRFRFGSPQSADWEEFDQIVGKP